MGLNHLRYDRNCLNWNYPHIWVAWPVNKLFLAWKIIKVRGLWQISYSLQWSWSMVKQQLHFQCGEWRSPGQHTWKLRSKHVKMFLLLAQKYKISLNGTFIKRLWYIFKHILRICKHALYYLCFSIWKKVKSWLKTCLIHYGLLPFFFFKRQKVLDLIYYFSDKYYQYNWLLWAVPLIFKFIDNNLSNWQVSQINPRNKLSFI